jgi:hypothetical protein
MSDEMINPLATPNNKLKEIEVTEEMILDGLDAYLEHGDPPDDHEESLKAIYRAMESARRCGSQKNENPERD